MELLKAAVYAIDVGIGFSRGQCMGWTRIVCTVPNKQSLPLSYPHLISSPWNSKASLSLSLSPSLPFIPNYSFHLTVTLAQQTHFLGNLMH